MGWANAGLQIPKNHGAAVWQRSPGKRSVEVRWRVSRLVLQASWAAVEQPIFNRRGTARGQPT